MQKRPPAETFLNKKNKALPREGVFQAGDLILHYLEQIGVECVFGIPGGSIEPLYNALARSQRRGGPRSIVVRHESGAAFMAYGYARETGKLGVCCATTGPGATNMLTGVACAHQDHVPLLAITAQTSLPSFGRGGVQESSCTGINTLAMFEPCTHYNSMVSHIDQLEHKLISAINAAMHHPKGAVHLSVPLDIMRQTVSVNASLNLSSLLSHSSYVDESAVYQLYRTLYDARRTVFVLGAGASEAVGTILELAVLINAQVVTTPHGKGLVSSYHPQYRGVYGLAGHQTAHALLNNPKVDAVLAIGTDLDEQATNGWEASALLSRRAVFIDSSSFYFSRAAMAHQHICGNIHSLFERLLARFYGGRDGDSHAVRPSLELTNQSDSPVIRFERRVDERRRRPQPHFEGVTSIREHAERRLIERRQGTPTPYMARRFSLNDENKYLSETTPIKPQRLMYDLSRLFPPNTRFLADIGNSFLWAIHYLHPYDRRIVGQHTTAGIIRIALGFSPMGWAIGAAVGTAAGSPGNPVVCITGDGALLMSGQELNTAVQEQLPVIFVVLNDAAFGTVKHGQRLSGAEPIGYELPPVDFVSYARAMGAEGFLITSPSDMAALNINTLCRHKGPTLLDVRIDPEEIPPLAERIRMLSGE